MAGSTRSGRRFRPETPKLPPRTTGNTSAANDSCPKLQLHLVRLNDGPFFKHWVLWVEYPKGTRNAARKHFACNVRGSSGTFRYEKELGDVRKNKALLDKHGAGFIAVADVDELEAIAKSIEIQNSVPSWNCQDYVLALLGELGNRGIMTWHKGMSVDRLFPLMDGLEPVCETG